jgi:hypothetical protein
MGRGRRDGVVSLRPEAALCYHLLSLLTIRVVLLYQRAKYYHTSFDRLRLNSKQKESL